MTILLASDCSESARSNPYVVQLLMAVTGTARDSGATVLHGAFWLRDPGLAPDILHLQWPEALFDWKEPSEEQLDALKRTITGWKKEKTRVVVTIHNECPHGRDTPRFKALYTQVYELADAFVHLGRESIPVLNKRYEQLVSDKHHRVILHGDYSWYPNLVSRSTARETLGLDQDRAIVLVFGQVRSTDELNLAIQGFRNARLENALLLFAGRLPHRSRKNPRHYLTRTPFYLNRKQMRLDEKFIKHEEVQFYLNACDVLLIPRITNINSGNVALGLSFGSAIVGPDTAVIGEQLQETANPVYQLGDDHSVSRAIVEGVKAARNGIGSNNKKWADEHLSWRKIGEDHLDLYSQLLTTNPHPQKTQ